MTTDILGNLKKAIIEYDPDSAASWARKAVEEQIDPLKVFDVLTTSIRQVGDAFGRGELFLPELIGAAQAMEAATPVITKELKKRDLKREPMGTVIIGTVLGDIHTIGKAMVSRLLTAEGFTVHDLGVNIGAEEFIKAVRDYTPNILAMSALLTTTAPEQAKVINALQDAGIRDKVKVMVGGGAITEEFARSIGADGYDPTAPGAVGLAKRLIGVE
ncbi:MAG: cobalamin-dependent protein [Desulfobacteraceae bacterium]|nr:cobalamin-dependent protein [Desulfobacteraceae bacterium]